MKSHFFFSPLQVRTLQFGNGEEQAQGLNSPISGLGLRPPVSPSSRVLALPGLLPPLLQGYCSLPVSRGLGPSFWKLIPSPEFSAVHRGGPHARCLGVTLCPLGS